MAEQPATSVSGSLRQTLSLYQTSLRAVYTNPLAWLFACIYILALLCFWLLGGKPADYWNYTAGTLLSLLLLLVLLPLTASAPEPAWKEKPVYKPASLRWQTVFLLACTAMFIAYTFFTFDYVLQLQLNFFLLEILDWLAPLVLLAFIPLLGMRLFGVPWRELGFARGYRVWLIVVIYALALILFSLIFFNVPALPDVVKAAIHAFIVAALPEEIFFRGILLTRLIRLLGTIEGVVISSLIFGIMHLAANLHSEPNVLLALSISILSQATTGLMLAILFVRTRNLVAGTIYHTLLDAL